MPSVWICPLQSIAKTSIWLRNGRKIRAEKLTCCLILPSMLWLSGWSRWYKSGVGTFSDKHNLPKRFMKFWLKWSQAGKLRFRQTFWKQCRQPSAVFSYSQQPAPDSKSSLQTSLRVTLWGAFASGLCLCVAGRLTWRCGCWGWCLGRPPGHRPSARSAT